METSKIYTHDEAAKILEIFENVLDEYNIKIPSPEDNEREPGNDAKLYGSTYSNLLDQIEKQIINLTEKAKKNPEIVTGEFSGNY